MLVGRNFMKKITRYSLVLILFSLLSISYLVTSASADDNVLPGMAGGQCDPNPACVENCCAPGPNNHGGPNDHHGGPGSCPEGPGYDACIAAESAASRTGGDHHPGGPNDHHGGPNDHGDPCMNMPPGPAQADCYRHKDDHRGPNDHHNGPNDHMRGPNDHGGPNDHMNRGPNDHGGPNDHMRGPNDHRGPPGDMRGDHRGPPGDMRGDHRGPTDCPAGTTCGGPNDHHGMPGGEDCAAMGMKDGSPHVDPPQNILDQVKAEYKANCKNGNCFLGEGNYKLLEDMGHMRAKVDCFLKEGERRHHDEHGGPNDHHGPN